MHGDLLDQGIALMLYGMGTVFVFLSLLVLVTQVMSWVIKRFFPEVFEPATAANVPGVPKDSEPPMAAITAAIHRFRSTRKK